MNVIVLGDVMIDINYFSKIERTAPEADIPIHNIYKEEYILGGAANVAQNLHNLDVNIEIISVIGNDIYGQKIKNILDNKKIKHNLFIDNTRKTTQKNRIFHNNKIQVRYDIEDIHEIEDELSYKILEYIKNKKIHAIVVSDYNKGVIQSQLIKNIIKYSNENNIYTFIDPKINNYLKYENCFCFKPNLKEGQEISNKTNISEIITFIKENIKCENIIITCGENGIVVNDNCNIVKHNEKINVVDVTGAGDIVLSVIVYIYLLKKDMYLACKIANYIAGKSVETIGNYCINKEIVDYCLCIKEDKIIYDYEIEKIKNISKLKNIVFTNGCFDILHSAHIKLLQFAKKQGDILIVGLNSDESIKRLKGNERPINIIEERKHILSLFDFIDYIIIFNEDTPLNIIKLIQPNILIKGSDYNNTNVIGSEYCNKLLFFNYIENKSSTLIINKIKNQ
jgi:D-beta-D-heptose 7-phosphate kinase/D-beta-D-heptose 1-phosphate adenosyltransferase